MQHISIWGVNSILQFDILQEFKRESQNKLPQEEELEFLSTPHELSGSESIKILAIIPLVLEPLFTILQG